MAVITPEAMLIVSWWYSGLFHFVLQSSSPFAFNAVKLWTIERISGSSHPLNLQ